MQTPMATLTISEYDGYGNRFCVEKKAVHHRDAACPYRHRTLQWMLHAHLAFTLLDARTDRVAMVFRPNSNAPTILLEVRGAVAACKHLFLVTYMLAAIVVVIIVPNYRTKS